MGSPFIHSDFEEVFLLEPAEYRKIINLGDVTYYLHPENFVYSTEVENLDQLKDPMTRCWTLSSYIA